MPQKPSAPEPSVPKTAPKPIDYCLDCNRAVSYTQPSKAGDKKTIYRPCKACSIKTAIKFDYLSAYAVCHASYHTAKSLNL